WRWNSFWNWLGVITRDPACTTPFEIGPPNIERMPPLPRKPKAITSRPMIAGPNHDLAKARKSRSIAPYRGQRGRPSSLRHGHGSGAASLWNDDGPAMPDKGR